MGPSVCLFSLLSLPRWADWGIGSSGGLGLVEIARVWTRFPLAFWRKTKWTPAGEKFLISCTVGTQTEVARSGGEPRWLGRGLGCGAEGILVSERGASGPSPAALVRGGSRDFSEMLPHCRPWVPARTCRLQTPNPCRERDPDGTAASAGLGSEWSQWTWLGSEKQCKCPSRFPVPRSPAALHWKSARGRRYGLFILQRFKGGGFPLSAACYLAVTAFRRRPRNNGAEGRKASHGFPPSALLVSPPPLLILVCE